MGVVEVLDQKVVDSLSAVFIYYFACFNAEPMQVAAVGAIP